jgi:O-6-methylguanine DNA methyltransferase
MTLYYDVFQIPLGWVGATVSERGLRRLTLRERPEQALEDLGKLLEQAVHSSERLNNVSNRLLTYCEGAPSSLDDLPLDLDDASPFFREAWKACRTIPAGETRSYAWLARAAGRPRAMRAAGQAMARNRVALVIPCHRVIGSDGGLHGYGGGLDLKARLLEMERQATTRVQAGSPA